MDINQVRQWYLAVGEWIDAWRLIPRLMVVGYSYLIYVVVDWYMTLQSYLIPNCVAEDITKCIVEAPTTQHAALVTAVISMAAVIFGLYTNSGRKWADGFRKWGDKTDEESNDSTSG